MQPTSTLTSPRQLRHRLFVVWLLLVAFVAALSWFFLQEIRQRYHEQAMVATQNLTQMLDLQIENAYSASQKN